MVDLGEKTAVKGPSHVAESWAGFTECTHWFLTWEKRTDFVR